MEYDLVSIGDSTIDVFLEVDTADTQANCNIDTEKCVICFPFGSKIPVKKLTRVAAVGNAANNAIGSARLGLKTAIYTVLGSDKDSVEIKEVFQEEGVAGDFVVMESGKRSNFSAVINYDGERNIFVYHEPKTYTFPPLPKSRWVYFSSVAEGHGDLHIQVPGYAKKFNVKLAFNPGSYQLREGIEGMKPVLQAAQALLLNREEAHELVDGDIGDIKGMLAKLLSTGPKIVVITDGPSGSYASIDGREVWYVGIPDVPVVERTGAGDAYSTGFVAALALEKSLPEAMVWGTMNASSVIGYVGAREGLLTQVKMQGFVEKYGEQAKPRMI